MDETLATAERLYSGVMMLEGVSCNRRCLRDAAAIFTECWENATDPNVKVEALYRKAQYFCYCGRRHFREALKLIKGESNPLNQLAVTPATRLQCRLIAIIIYDANDPDEVRPEQYQQVFAEAVEPKLKADAAFHLGELLLRRRKPETALKWFKRAYAQLKSIDNPDHLAIHAKIAVVGALGSSLQCTSTFTNRRALALFRKAETEWALIIKDPCVWASYWKNRAAAARECGPWQCRLSYLVHYRYFRLRCWWQKRRR